MAAALGDLQKTLTPRCAVRARSAMAGWSVETQRESKRPKEVMADRVHDSRGTFMVTHSGSKWRGAYFVYRVSYQLVNLGWVGYGHDSSSKFSAQFCFGRWYLGRNG